MPLINRKPFVRIEPPSDLRAHEEVFVCRTTKEMFRDYNKFFERTILCNSLVWSCQVTGRSELTFQEALDSEERALGVLNSLPVALHPPLLALASLTRRTRMQDVCEDVHGFVRQRFFVGEQVEANLPGKSRQTSLVLEVLSALTHNGAANGHMADGEGVSDEEEYDEEKTLPTGSGSDSLQRPNSSPDQCYYRVQPLGIEGLDATVVGVDHICRRKGTLTREKLRIFMKRHCELYHGTYRVKPNSALLYKLDTFDLESVFPGGLPAFPRAMQTRARGHSSRSNKSLTQHSPSIAVGAMEVSAQPCMHENRTPYSPKPELTYNHTKVNDFLFKDSQYLQQQRELLQKQLDEAKEQLRQRKLEEKQQLKLLRDEKREKMREEKRQHAEKMKEWRRPREDLECEDLQALPKPSPLCTPIPPNLFGDVVMLLEFLHAFGGFFHLKDEFPKGLNLGVLEEAFMDSNPNGPLCDLLFFFLSSISAGQADEELERQNHSADHDAVTGLSEALEEVEQDSTKTAISSVAALAAAWPIFHQGCPLNKLELDSCTLSEILRLHVLASGADIDLSNALFRYRQHGGYDAADDPCVELRLKWPSLLRHLALFSVYDLRPDEKVRILHALCGQLLTLVTTREYIEKSFEQLKQARQDLRELRSAGIRRQREEAAARYRKRKEQKLLEQQERVSNNVFPCEPALESSSTAVDRDSTFEQAEPVLVDSQRDEYPEKTSDDDKVMESNLLSLRSYKLACPQQADTANGEAEASATLPEKGTATKVDLAEAERLEQAQALQQQEAERELLKRIWAATARTNVAPLGRDRYFSRYWLFHSLHGLFVEHSGEYFEEQAVTPTPTSTAVDDDGDKSGVSTLPDEGSTTAVQDSAASEVKQSRDTSPSQSGVDTGSTWSVFHSPEQLDELLATLNPRGHREGALREALLQDLDRVRSKLKPDRLQNLIGNEQSPKGRTKATGEDLAEGILEQTLREYLLSLEERIWKGSVGRIKVDDRQIWRTALMTGGYDPQCTELHWGGSRQHKLMWSLSGEKTKVHGEGQSPSSDRLRDPKVEQCGGTGPSEGNSTLPANTTVHGLALSLLQMEQAVAHRFLTPPFGNAEKGKVGRKTKKKKDHKSVKQEQEDASCDRDEGAKGAVQSRSLLNRWEESLVACTSLSQVFVHLSTLDRSILWEKSALHARCHLCGRKCDPSNMLLCDSCDRGHHLYCLRPKLKAVPEGDWFCPECRPKRRGRPPKKRHHCPPKNEGDENNEKKRVVGTREGEERIKKENVQVTPAHVWDVEKAHLRQNKRQCHSPAEQVPASSPMEGKVRRGRPPGSGEKALQSKSIEEAKERSKESNSILSDYSPEKRPRKKGGKEEIWRRSSGRHYGVHELSACEKLAVELVRHDDSWPFLRPVLRSHVPDYYDIIKQPIALNMIREKLNSCHYQSASEFVRDMELMFSNCFAYNALQMAEAQAGKRLQAFFHERASTLGLLCQLPVSSSAVPDFSDDDHPSSQSKRSRQ